MKRGWETVESDHDLDIQRKHPDHVGCRGVS